MANKASTFTLPVREQGSSIRGSEPTPEVARSPGGVRTYKGDVLRGAVAIASYYPGDPAAYRKIYQWAATGRFPHFREGKTIICSRKSTIDRWIELTEMYGLLGKTWGQDDVIKYFGPGSAGERKARSGQETASEHSSVGSGSMPFRNTARK
jgi:hypothetical protein